MLHSEAKTKSQRSIHTIMDNTRVIDTIEPQRSQFSDTVEVRRMLSRSRTEYQHFIVTLLSDVNRACDTEKVVRPFAELAIRGDKLRYTVKPYKQYPDMCINKKILLMIEYSVASFMQNQFHKKVVVTNSMDQDGLKGCHLQ